MLRRGRSAADALIKSQPGSLTIGRAHLWALALSAITALFVLLHVVWFVGVPSDLDSFNFILGVRRFDVAHNQPHPPGAPVYIAAGKVATSLWRAAGLPFDPLAGPEPPTLAALSLVSAALSILVLGFLARRSGEGPLHVWYMTLIVASAPLTWLLAARPMSDMPGLLLVLLAYLGVTTGRLRTAALFAGIAAGVRVQTSLLTVPVLIVGLARTRSWKVAVHTCGMFVLAVVGWLLPMLAVTGAARYWAALAHQARDDWASPVMFAAAPTLRNASAALVNTFARPWGNPVLATAVLLAAAIGAYRVVRSSPRGAGVLAIYAAPYVVFHLVLQETSTIRYALPVMLGFSYLVAVAIDAIPWRQRRAVLVLLVAGTLFVSARSLYGVVRTGSPAMRLLTAMYHRASEESPAFVVAHENLKLRRVQRILPAPPPWKAAWAAAPYEWRTVADHWKSGATAPVWFVANPRRTDLSLIDRRSQHVLGSYKLDVQAAWILRGVRPRAFTWLEFGPPAWLALRGFALTPETGGVAARDGDGPASGGAVALVRRYGGGAVLALAGRHVGAADDPDVRIAIEIDGRSVGSVLASARSRDYRALIHLRAEQLAGDTPYATLTVRSSPLAAAARLVPVTVEYLDYQPEGGALLSLSSGWHEPELRTDNGLTWRWAAPRASVLIHRQPGTAVELFLAGDAPLPRGSAASLIQVSSNGHALDAFEGVAFSRRIVVPPDASERCDVDVTITASAWFVPHDFGQGEDRRELAFRAFTIEANPLPRFGRAVDQARSGNRPGSPASGPGAAGILFPTSTSYAQPRSNAPRQSATIGTHHQ